MIDNTDLEILTILQQNARTSNAEIARQVGMAPSAILERIRKLEARGVIKHYGHVYRYDLHNRHENDCLDQKLLALKQQFAALH